MWKCLNEHFEELLGAVILAVMVTVAFVNVVVRYCSTFSFAWSEEITTNLFVWIVLLGTSCAFRDQTHLSVNIFYAKFPKALRILCYSLSVLLCTAFFGFLCYTGVLEVLDEIELERVSDSLELPYYWYSSAVPLFSILILVRLFQRVYNDISQHSI